MLADSPQALYLAIEVVSLPYQFSVSLGHLLGCVRDAKKGTSVYLLKCAAF
ncbi:MAG: hypothetical protein KKF85_03565 [Gammaproteobacteria bacterium]|nr:hypothetical protein [Gammaproteobacteria bacterium]MBU3987768.1 hypothetical protein [Gammaproteobacteria bacterium]MBU4003379.1 hypothetical protein [Gammaproteobacteria bacterium]MBU4021850.1 hypothetical protein [Gammaproteobacteria bacterium]MBU4096549.1 hypothetical protein [Gammaproteobacteria bacterium]